MGLAVSRSAIEEIAKSAKLKRIKEAGPWDGAWLVIKDRRTIGWIEKEITRNGRVRWYAMGPNGQSRWGFSKRFLAVGNLIIEYEAYVATSSHSQNCWIRMVKELLDGPDSS